MSAHWGGRALLRGGVSRSGEGEGLRQTWRSCSTKRDGQGQRPRGDAQGVQDKEARRAEPSRNEGNEGVDGAGGARGHSSKRERRGLMWSEDFKESLLCFAENNKWGRVRMGTNEKATVII